jgi:hypothetical protein
MTQPGQIGFASRITTTLTGGGRSVIGNVTISFCAAVSGAVLFGGAFLLAGASPWLALVAFCVTALFFILFLLLTLNHAASYPDSAVTSEEYYARVVETRMGAKDPRIIRNELPVVGGSSEVIQAIVVSQKADDDV